MAEIDPWSRASIQGIETIFEVDGEVKNTARNDDKEYLVGVSTSSIVSVNVAFAQGFSVLSADCMKLVLYVDGVKVSSECVPGTLFGKNQPQVKRRLSSGKIIMRRAGEAGWRNVADFEVRAVEKLQHPKLNWPDTPDGNKMNSAAFKRLGDREINNIGLLRLEVTRCTHLPKSTYTDYADHISFRSAGLLPAWKKVATKTPFAIRLGKHNRDPASNLISTACERKNPSMRLIRTWRLASPASVEAQQSRNETAAQEAAEAKKNGPKKKRKLNGRVQPWSSIKWTDPADSFVAEEERRRGKKFSPRSRLLWHSLAGAAHEDQMQRRLCLSVEEHAALFPKPTVTATEEAMSEDGSEADVVARKARMDLHHDMELKNMASRKDIRRAEYLIAMARIQAGTGRREIAHGMKRKRGEEIVV